MALVGLSGGVVTLDVAETQVLVYRPADARGLLWHHWVLLKRLAPGQWLGLTPLGAVERVDLTNVQHVVLERLAQFPTAQRATVFAHDPVSRAALEGHKRRAATTAALLGDADLQDIQSSSWRVAEPQRPDFAVEVDANIINDPVTGLSFDRKGVIMIRGEEVFVEKILTADLDTWKLGLSPTSTDKRLLDADRWTKPERTKTLATSLEVATSDVLTGFPLNGERSALEHAQSVQEGAGGYIVYHSEWVRDSGINENSSTAHIHRTVCETLRLLWTYDLTNVPNLAAGEQLTRWLIQTELATERNPRHPDFTGLDIATGTVIHKSGRANAGKYHTWLTGRLQEQGTLWKQDRLYRQEQTRLRGKGGGAGGGDETSDEQGDDQRKKKKKQPTQPKGPPKGGRKGEAPAEDGAKGASGGK